MECGEKASREGLVSENTVRSRIYRTSTLGMRTERASDYGRIDDFMGGEYVCECAADGVNVYGRHGCVSAGGVGGNGIRGGYVGSPMTSPTASPHDEAHGEPYSAPYDGPDEQQLDGEPRASRTPSSPATDPTNTLLQNCRAFVCFAL